MEMINIPIGHLCNFHSTTKMDLLQGTLDMLILRVLERGRMHGWGIAQRIRQASKDVLTVEMGSLRPALNKMERQG